MDKYDFSILERFSSGPVIGFSYYEPDPVGEYNYYEIDIYLIFIQLRLRWE
jgi:hypothetical protein